VYLFGYTRRSLGSFLCHGFTALLAVEQAQCHSAGKENQALSGMPLPKMVVVGRWFDGRAISRRS
jgi:hypothetical protein